MTARSRVQITPKAKPQPRVPRQKEKAPKPEKEGNRGELRDRLADLKGRLYETDARATASSLVAENLLYINKRLEDSIAQLDKKLKTVLAANKELQAKLAAKEK